MIQLETSKGDPFFISLEDVERVSLHRWHTTSFGYVATNIKVGRRYAHTRLHRFILNVSDERIWVDHIDGNPFNNTRENLRQCSRRQNAANQRPRRGASSAYKGVGFAGPGRSRQWRANIRGSIIGHFATEEEAALAYDAAARFEYGPFAYLNFPDRDEPLTGTKLLSGVCLHCGGAFTAKDRRKKCCSKSCSTMHWKRTRDMGVFG